MGLAAGTIVGVALGFGGGRLVAIVTALSGRKGRKSFRLDTGFMLNTSDFEAS
jgi:hypothetical protein